MVRTAGIASTAVCSSRPRATFTCSVLQTSRSLVCSTPKPQQHLARTNSGSKHSVNTVPRHCRQQQRASGRHKHTVALPTTMQKRCKSARQLLPAAARLRHDGGGHLHKVHAALVAGRSEAAHVADHAAAQCDKRHPAVQARFEGGVPNLKAANMTFGRQVQG